MDNYLDDDENVKAMRETARTIGLTQLLLDIHQSNQMPDDDAARLHFALEALGASREELARPTGDDAAEEAAREERDARMIEWDRRLRGVDGAST